MRDLRTSDNTGPPYRSAMVTLLRITPDRTVTQAYNVGEKQELLRELTDDDLLIAVWTGRYHSDAFSVNLADVREALAAR